MKRISHRGAAGYAPDNTVAAIEEGLEQGADMIEVDARLLQDGVLALTHDWYLWNDEEVLDLIHRNTYDHLQNLMEHENGESLAQLSDGIDVIEDYEAADAGLMIDMKGVWNKRETGEAVADEVYRRVTEHNWDPEDILACTKHPVKIKSFRRRWQERAAADDGYPADELERPATGLAARKWLPRGLQRHYAEKASELDVDAVHYPHKFWAGPIPQRIDQALVDDAHSYGLDVYVWGPSNEDDIAYVTELGVDGIISDHVGRISTD